MPLVSSGLNWSETPPTNARCEIIAVQFKLQTSAVVGDREMNLLLNNGANVMIIGTSPIKQAASLTKWYNFGHHGSYYANSDSDRIYIPISTSLFLLEGWTIDADLLNIKSGDTFRDLTIIYKVWTFEQ